MSEKKKDAAKKPAKQTNKKKNLNKNTKSGVKSANKSAAKSAPKKPAKKKPASPLRIIPLGGINEIGKNITAYEYENDIIIVDCGMSFPDDDMLGIDIVIPDFTYLIKNQEKIRGLFITHGHEDHIGGVPYLLKEINVPIFATGLTIGLIEGKLKEHGLLGDAMLHVVNAGSVVKAGKFSVEFIHVNHSIADAVAFAIKCPLGTVVQTGDFKIDTTPIDGKVIDLGRLAELGNEGVLALLSDSTNAERPGFSASEKIVGESFSNIFSKANNQRIIVATFSSNVHRIQQIMDEAAKLGRKVAVSGRSMVNLINVASELGYLNIPEGILIDISMVKKYAPEQLVIITTGSQGEELSALHRMAFSDHRQVEITPNDLIIISATPIPGNEKLVNKVINELTRLGAKVVYEKMYDVHVSGHACQEEQKLMLSLVKPRFFVPVHGEQKHLRKHSETAVSLGVKKENIIVSEIGKVIEFTAKQVKCVEAVEAGRVLVDGLGIGDVGSVVLRDRKHLAEDGIIVVVLCLDSATGEMISGPEVISRGFVYVKGSEELMDETREIVWDVAESTPIRSQKDWNTMKTRIRDSVSHHLYRRTGRSPMILPIIMEV